MEEYRIRIACFLILSFSIVLLASQGTSSSYLNKSWAGEPKDNSSSDNDQEISTVPSQNSEGDNQTVNKLTDEVVSGDVLPIFFANGSALNFNHLIFVI